MVRYSLTALTIGIAVTLPLTAVAVLLPSAGISPYIAASAGIALVAAMLGLAAGVAAVVVASATVLLVEVPLVDGSGAARSQDAFALALFTIDGLVVAVIGSLLHRHRSSGSSTPGARSAEAAPGATLELPRIGEGIEAARSPLSLRVEPLSDRETDVLMLLATGRSNAEIGEALFISTNTVKSHLKNVYGKLEVDSRTGALSRAFELGIIRTTHPRPAPTHGSRAASDAGGLDEELAA